LKWQCGSELTSLSIYNTDKQIVISDKELCKLYSDNTGHYAKYYTIHHTYHPDNIDFSFEWYNGKFKCCWYDEEDVTLDYLEERLIKALVHNLKPKFWC
jgi:hypothetical protein